MDPCTSDGIHRSSSAESPLPAGSRTARVIPLPPFPVKYGDDGCATDAGWAAAGAVAVCVLGTGVAAGRPACAGLCPVGAGLAHDTAAKPTSAVMPKTQRTSNGVRLLFMSKTPLEYACRQVCGKGRDCRPGKVFAPETCSAPAWGMDRRQ